MLGIIFLFLLESKVNSFRFNLLGKVSNKFTLLDSNSLSDDYRIKTKHILGTQSYIQDTNFDLLEIVDSESFTTSIYLTNVGDIIMNETNGPYPQDFRGSWRISDGILHMVMERTFQGKYTEYSIKSHYVGTIEEEYSVASNFIIEGNICDEMCAPDREQSVGKFFLLCNSKTVNKQPSRNPYYPLSRNKPFS